MTLTSELKDIVSRFLQDPSNGSVVRELGTSYWEALSKSLGDCFRSGQDAKSFIQENRSFIDYGLVPEIRDSVEVEQHAPDTQSTPVEIQSMSDWLSWTIDQMTGAHREEALRRDIGREKMQMQKLQNEFSSQQSARKDILIQQISMTGGMDSWSREAIAALPETDSLTMDIARFRQSTARGTVLSAEDRRAAAAREADAQQRAGNADALLSRIASEPFRAEVRSINRRISELVAEIVKHEGKIASLESDVENLQHEQESKSPLELENSLSSELDYLRDLIRLSSKRMHADSCSILRPDDVVFSPAKVQECLKTILEMDPRLFRNDRASFLGKPTMVLVPGNGKSLYDWKNNRFVVPLVPPAGKFIDSFVSAVIEYRLDVDDDKTMLTSYCKLPHMKGVRSLFQIKSNFTKDYTTWIISEANGFKVLPRETRAWFEHEVAPQKNDIYCPQEFQPFNVSQSEFQRMLEHVEEKLSGDSPEEQRAEDLWACSILSFQQGKTDRALECIKEFVSHKPEQPFGQYNLGQIAMAASSKPEAISGFTEFSKLNQRSWWAGVARDHLRRLQMG